MTLYPQAFPPFFRAHVEPPAKAPVDNNNMTLLQLTGIEPGNVDKQLAVNKALPTEKRTLETVYSAGHSIRNAHLTREAKLRYRKSTRSGLSQMRQLRTLQ